MDNNNRQGGASRRFPPQSSTSGGNDSYFSMDFVSTDMSYGGPPSGAAPPPPQDTGRRSATATPGPATSSSSGNFAPSNPYGGGFNAPMDQSFGGGYGGPPPGAQYNPYGGPQGGQVPQQGGFGGGIGGPTGGITSPFGPQQQFLMAAGEQLFTNPMTKAAIDAYTGSMIDRSKTWIGGVKCYFAVDTSYVIKKLMLIFLPFLHKDWCIRYSSTDQTLTPREEPNLPDLYIPSMAFITYCLLSGYILGLQNRFAPEQLGIYASSALAWLLLEVFIIVVAKYVLNMSSVLGFFHLIAFGGYKFVCIVSILLVALVAGPTGFTAAFIYSTLTLMYFLLRSLNANMQTSSQANYAPNDTPRIGQYLVIVVCLFQPVVMYFLTSSLKSNPIITPAK